MPSNMDTQAPQPTDEQIVLEIQQGNKEKFGILMERYDKKLSRYGRRFLSDQENIEDIVQDVFISTFQNIYNFDTSLKFSSWIYRIAHNAFVDGLKRKQKAPLFGLDLDIFVSHHGYMSEKVEQEEQDKMKRMLDMGLDELKPKYKEAVILHYLEGFSYKEISDILRIPTGTVGIRVMRAKEALRKIYEKKNIRIDQHINYEQH